MLTERLQVLIGVEQRERLEQLAQQRKTSVATLVREAIDLAYPSASPRRAEAFAAILNAAPMHVGTPDELRAEIDELRAGSH